MLFSKSQGLCVTRWSLKSVRPSPTRLPCLYQRGLSDHLVLSQDFTSENTEFREGEWATENGHVTAGLFSMLLYADISEASN